MSSKSSILAALVPNHTLKCLKSKKKLKWLLGWNNWRREAGWKFEMWGGHDQNREKHLKNILGCNTKKYPLKNKLKRKNLEWFGPVTEGMAFLMWKIKINIILKISFLKT